MKYKKLVFLGLTSFGLFALSGCSNNQPQPTVITKKILYTPSIEEKKAIAILIYKQNELEKRVNELEKNKGISYATISSTKLKRSINNKRNVCTFTKQKVVKYCNTNISSKDVYIAKSDVNIRQCATIHSPVVGKIKKGEKVNFIYCNKYCWCLLKDKRGYVFKKLFTKLKVKESKKSHKKIKGMISISNNKKNTKELTPDEVIKNYINSK